MATESMAGKAALTGGLWSLAATCPILCSYALGDKGAMCPELHSQNNDNTETDTLAVNLAASVRDLINAYAKGAAQLMHIYGISPVEFSLLQVCMERRESTATDLAQVLPVDASRISRIVTGLVKKGLLIRRRLRKDRRIVMLRLSEQGMELTEMVERHLATYDARLADNIGEKDLSTFRSVILKILANQAAMKPHL